VSRFSELDEYLAIPRLTSIRLAPDGTWLAAAVQTLSQDRKKFTSSIWRVDTGGGSATRLTRSAAGESNPEFLPDGSLLFVSARSAGSAGDSGSGEGDKPALWLLPAGGGEASRVTAPPGGVSGVAVARRAQAFMLSTGMFAGSKDADEDAARRKARADAGVNAILHETEVVRHWDHDLGPDCLRLHAGAIAEESIAAGAPDTEGADTEGGATRDLTPDAGRALDDQTFGMSPDGSLAVSGWRVTDTPGSLRIEVAVIDVRTAQRRTLLRDSGHDFSDPAVAPDGKLLVAFRTEHDSYDRPGDVTLVVAPLDDAPAGSARDLLPGFDRRPLTAQWSADSQSVYFTAEDNGRCPVFVVDVATGQVRQVTADDAAYDCLCPAPDGRALYALRAAISEPAAPVRIDVADPAAAPVRLANPCGTVQVPGQVRDVAATAEDGTTVRGWLVLPDGTSVQSRVPLLLWVHGGPVMSWTTWSWRWNPWLMAARGYAVLLPDPALSTGYGQDFIARGHGDWGGKPYTDLMAITDAVLALPEIDEGRTAIMGGSFGGYMANWIAGHTDRFAAIVSHAGLWALDQMFGTTDGPYYWRRAFGWSTTDPRRYGASSPHLHAADIVTPLLIIHGDKDYRVPIGEALRMYSDLAVLGKEARFLYFPDESHWILKPGDAKVWYETVFAFLAEHVLGEKWQSPALL